MSSAHIIYIPLVLIVGMVLGFVLGGRAARDAENLHAKRDAERAAAREARKKKRESAS